MPGVDEFDARLARSALRVLDSLDRMDEHYEQHFAADRKHTRRRFRMVITISIPDTATPWSGATKENSVRVWGRAISEDGLSFIHVARIRAKIVYVGMDLPSGETTWIRSEVMRVKEVGGEGFFEYGVQFLDRC